MGSTYYPNGNLITERTQAVYDLIPYTMRRDLSIKWAKGNKYEIFVSEHSKHPWHRIFKHSGLNILMLVPLFVEKSFQFLWEDNVES